MTSVRLGLRQILIAASLWVVVPGLATVGRGESLPEQPGFETSEFIYETAPFPSCHASTIEETEDGLIAAWFGGTEEGQADVGIWIAHHDGQWSKPIEIANGMVSAEERYPAWNPVLFQPASGPLRLFYKVGPSPREWWGMLTTSDDGGRNWSAPRRLEDGILGPIKNKLIQLSNGDILAGSSTEHDGWRVHFERSTDSGHNWEATDAVNDGRAIQAIQPSILVHKNGELQAVGRTKSKRVFQTKSDDNGRTWNQLTLTDLPNPNAGTDAVTLKDGRHLIVYNHNPESGGRSPLNVAISDDGEKWYAALVLENEPDQEFSYPAVIQTDDGMVHITYTWKRERIKHVVVDPEKLRAKPIVNGKWPGVE